MAKKQQLSRNTTVRETRVYVSQSDVPVYSLEEALRIPRAVLDHYNGRPATPLQVATALELTPTSGTFRSLCGASIAYGLTSGGYNAPHITVEAIGKRIVRPTEDGDDVAARRNALMKPRVISEFLQRYAGGALPRHDIALNVLVELGVPRDRAESVFRLVLDSAQKVGFIREIKGKQFIDLDGIELPDESTFASFSNDEANGTTSVIRSGASEEAPSVKLPINDQRVLRVSNPLSSRRVFITHGKNKSFIDPIKRLLGFGEMTPIVSVDRQSVSKPVPEKVMDDMRSCGAAIIHVDEEQTLVDKDAHPHVVINPNVLIEIGAAMALFGRRFILLVKDGVTLPSNLQGLYEVRYEGDVLDGLATIRLLEAINDIKNNPLPKRDDVNDEA